MSDLHDYLDATIGDTEGWLTGGIGIGGHYTANGKYEFKEFVPRFYRWPDEAERAERELTQEAHLHDVYLCPYIMRYAARREGEAVTHQLVHNDIDGDLSLDKVHEIGGFVVASGTPGHVHVYVPLAEPVPAVWHRSLCEGLRDYLGGDNKIRDNDLLRPPGTFNHKQAAKGGEPAPVEWLVRP